MENPVIQNLASNWGLNEKVKTHRGKVRIRDLIVSFSVIDILADPGQFT